MNQEKTEYITYPYNEERTSWKKSERKKKESVGLAPSRALLICKEKIEKTANIDEIIFYLKSICIQHIMRSQGPLLMIF